MVCIMLTVSCRLQYKIKGRWKNYTSDYVITGKGSAKDFLLNLFF